MSEQLKEDGITDKLASMIFRKGMLSLPFSHQQTWLERRSTQAGRQSNQGPFSPDIHICSAPLMDLEALNLFECGLEGMHQSTVSIFFFKPIMNAMKGFCQGSNSDGCVILACKSKAGREWHHLRGRLDGGFFDVLGYLQQAGRPCWRDTRHLDPSWYLQDPAGYTWENQDQVSWSTHNTLDDSSLLPLGFIFCSFVHKFYHLR